MIEYHTKPPSLSFSISDLCLDCIKCDFNLDVHLENIGWVNGISPGKVAGTEGYGRRLEAIRYGVHVASLGMHR